ncbi:MAG TPA: hypothetical protein VH396_12810 [Chitinophagaceae bacterium]
MADIFIRILYQKRNFRQQIFTMSKKEIKDEISKVLDHFSDEALSELLNFLKELDSKNTPKISSKISLDRILYEDKELLARLAQ